MTIFDAQHIHLTGFKGVAMTSLAQCLSEMSKTLSGSDLAEDFVTKDVLKSIEITSNSSFDPLKIPKETDLLIYTAAHKGPNNPEVLWAKEQAIQVLSQAEALSQLFNEKKGIAVCGVGGKSSTSAMLSWIFHTLHQPISFSVGVGNIIGLNKTGQWQKDSEYFVAEADEYVIDPHAAQKGETIVPRFSFLKPQVIICTQIAFDHPDVYKDFDHTKQVFLDFFLSLKPNGTLIIDGDQAELKVLAEKVKSQRQDVEVLTFGEVRTDSLSFEAIRYERSHLFTTIQTEGQRKTLELLVPGRHNVDNACAALLATKIVGISIDQSIQALASFQSTQRRFEFKGEKKGVLYYDDYAHHPREIDVVIETVLAMFPDHQIFVAFQPHTFSRTKALFDEFAKVLAKAPHTIITDIFASAREEADPSISSKMLADAAAKYSRSESVQYIPTLEELAQYCETQLSPSSVLITLGAGDIYTIHDKIRG